MMALAAAALIFGLSGCGKKENTAKEHTADTVTVPEEQNATPSAEKGSLPQGKQFTLTDHNGITHTVMFDKQQLLLQDIAKPIVILHFFSTWSQPCQGEAPYLSDLQNKYKKRVSILGILLHPDNYLQELDNFIKKDHLAYFISSGSQNDAFAKAVTKQLSLPEMLPIPLTVIYHNGQYYKHYEGVVPVEMLVHDIDTLLK